MPYLKQKMSVLSFVLLLFIMSETTFTSSEISTGHKVKHVLDTATRVTIDLDSPINEVDEDYLSVTIDSQSIHDKWSDIDFNAAKVINMAKALSPAYVRVGGTPGDFLIFRRNTSNQVTETFVNFTMTPEQWDELNVFVNKVEWRLIFGLNNLLRQPNGEWDSTNAELLIDYTMKKGYQVAWELGNEPDLYYHFNATVTPKQDVNGVHTLRYLLMKRQYPVLLIAGPDCAGGGDYFKKYVLEIGNDVNAITWHHYYGKGTTTTLIDFYSVDVLDRLYNAIDTIMNALKGTSFTGDLWLGETSSTYDGGTKLYSQSYVAGFMWLDNLGVSAYHHKKVFRQDFVGKNYSLLDENNDPLPDYWLSLLHKQLVGRKVLRVEGALERGRQVRVYAHCAKSPYPKGSVVLIILNTIDNETIITLTNNELINSDQDIYWLTPSPVTNITSQVVSLNREPLKLINDKEIPVLRPDIHSANSEIRLSSRSFGFVVFKKANVKACMN